MCLKSVRVCVCVRDTLREEHEESEERKPEGQIIGS